MFLDDTIKLTWKEAKKQNFLRPNWCLAFQDDSMDATWNFLYVKVHTKHWCCASQNESLYLMRRCFTLYFMEFFFFFGKVTVRSSMQLIIFNKENITSFTWKKRLFFCPFRKYSASENTHNRVKELGSDTDSALTWNMTAMVWIWIMYLLSPYIGA
jgi:hypothetical protein